MFANFLKLTLFAIFVNFSLISCGQKTETSFPELTIGVINYEQNIKGMQPYQTFKNYLAQQTKSFIILEPTLNELNALENIRRQKWSIVFANSGLTAIAISEADYLPIFRSKDINNLRSVLVVKQDSDVNNLTDLANKTIALGQPGSALGYYLPLYDLYGLTLAEIMFASTPKTALNLLQENKIEAVALSEEEFRLYKKDFPESEFRILHRTKPIPPGSVLLSSQLDEQQQAKLIEVMKNAPPNIALDLNYLPQASVPDYQELIKIINKIKPLESKLKQKPVILIHSKN